ncbi:MAG TPA: hypothetical protein VE619_08275, partial [Nitrososphaeraceae archaeon]|nr:hypothetical protein [Nitrososphaeraceae archaeon]
HFITCSMHLRTGMHISVFIDAYFEADFSPLRRYYPLMIHLTYLTTYLAAYLTHLKKVFI